MGAEPGISSAIVLPVLRALGELGFVLPAPSADVVPGDAADATIDAAAKQLKSETVGLDTARRIPIGSLGMLDYALCTSRTLREGLNRTAKYYGLATQRARLTLVESGPTVTLEFRRHTGATQHRYWVEFASAIITERIRGTLGVPVEFSRVAFTHAKPASTKAHDAFFGRTIEWAAPLDVLSFPAALLELPLRTAAASLADVLEVKMQTLQPTDEADAFVVQARQVVLELLERQDVGLGSVVARMQVTRRTLQRELQRRGTSHKELLDDARRGRARELLETGSLTVAQVSERLGFSEPSAFFRAFRRWTGQSPKAATKKPTAQSRAHSS